MDQQRDRTRERLLDALERCAGNRRQAGEFLGVGRATLYRWLERCELDGDVLRRIGGRFEVQSLIERTEHAAVFLVRDRSGDLGETALRLLRCGSLAPQERERLGRELATLTLPRHRSLVRVHLHGWDQATDRPFYVMDRVDGEPFPLALARRPAGEVARALIEALEAVSHLHRHSLVHGVLSGENVRVTRRSGSGRGTRVVVMDSGDALAGPPLSGHWVAPELLRGAAPTPAGDVYALGMLARLALTGRARGAPGWGPAVPAGLESILTRMIAEAPDARFEDASAALGALVAWTEGPDGRRALSAPALGLVGRGAEAEAVRGWLERQEAGSDAIPCLLVVADGGLGKSTFLEACRVEFAERFERIASAACPAGGQAGIDPILSIVRDLLDAPDDALVGALRDRYHELLLRVDDPDRLRDASRFQLFDGIVSLLVDIAERRPLLLVLDDLHLADSTLVDLLWHLTRRSRRVPLRLLAAARPAGPEADVNAWIRGAGAEGLVELIPLAPLDRDTVRELARWELGDARSSVLADEIHRVSGGHPLFVNQLLQDCAERGSVSLDADRLSFPPTLAETVRTRLARLDARAWDVLSIVATGRPPVSLEDLQAFHGPDSGEFVAELCDRHLLTRSADGGLRLAHALLGDIIGGEIPAARRERQHRAWANYLADRPERLLERAEHLLSCRASSEEGAVLREAARWLSSRWRYRAAIDYLKAALERSPARSVETSEIFAELARACRQAHATSEAIETGTRWAEHAAACGDGLEEARALTFLAISLREDSDWERARSAAERAVELSEGSGDPKATSLALKTLASVLWETWRHDEAVTPIERALELARAGDDRRALANALHDTSLIYAITGRVAEALAATEQARDIFLELDDPVWALLSKTPRAMILASLGDMVGAAEMTRELIDGVEDLEGEIPVELPLENLVHLLCRMGLYGDVLDQGRRLIDVATRIGRHEKRVSALLAMGEALHQIGDYGTSREHGRLALELARAIGDDRQELYARLAVARDLRRDGRLRDAEAELREVHDGARERASLKQQALAAIELARTHLEGGDVGQAQVWLDAAEQPMKVAFEESAPLRAMSLAVRARAWALSGRQALAYAAAAEALALSRHRGPASVTLQLLGSLAEWHDREGRASHALEARRKLAVLVREIANSLKDPAQRSLFLARRDWADLPLDAAHARETDVPREVGRLLDLLRDGADPDRLLADALALAARLAGARRGLLMVPAAGQRRLWPAASHGFEGQLQHELLRLPESLVERVQDRGPVLVTDVRRDPSLAEDRSLSISGLGTVLAIPLRYGRPESGVLFLGSREPRSLDGQQDTVAPVAALVATALRLYTLEDRLLGPDRDRDREAASGPRRCEELISASPRMHEVFDVLERVADSDLSVLILGESGTGKELVARALHALSSRGDQVFVSENCAAIPETLLESILFGHIRGAFTGADEDRPGLFETASGGTLLLDEVAEMSAGLQAKLLRVLQERVYRPLGAQETRPTDVRIVAATHRDPSELLESGALRSDLYYRLNGVTISLPPLRERREDIPHLLAHFLRRQCAREEREVPELSVSVRRTLLAHAWPGNVRELENLARRMLLLTDGRRIDWNDLRNDPEFARLATSDEAPSAAETAPRSPEPGERDLLLRALEQSGGNRVRAAEILGIGRATLYRRLRKHGLGSETP